MSSSSNSHNHHEENFIQKYIFSVDHKVIGIQYGITSLLFLLFGFSLMAIMRWQLAYPGTEIPIVGFIFGESGILASEQYNSLRAMHGTIMIFLGIVPLAVGAFGNYLVPLQIGAIDMAFPKLNAASYWTYAVGGIIMISSFFMPEGAARSGWTSYPPLNYVFFAWINEYHRNYCPIKGSWLNLDETSNFYLGSICNFFFTSFGFPSA